MNKDLYIGNVLSGAQFNEIFHNVQLFKLTNDTEYHNGFQFDDGLNIDTVKFTPKGSCEPGGIYFTEEKWIWKWICYRQQIMIYIRGVTIPNDAQVYIEENKFKADKLILGPREKINRDVYLQSMNYKNGGHTILKHLPKYMKDKDMCMEFVKCNGYALQYVPEVIIDKEICIAAIKQQPHAFRYVPSHIRDDDIMDYTKEILYANYFQKNN